MSHPADIASPRIAGRRVALVAGLTLLAALAWQCGPERRPDDGGAARPDEAAAMTFGWRPGDGFDLVYAAQRKGSVVEVRTQGAVTAEGKDALRIHFEPPDLDEKDKKLVVPGKSHAYVDAWPDLVVDRKTGALRSVVGGSDPAAEVAAAHRWQLFTALVGFQLPAGRERSYKTEIEAGEGLLVPVKVVERHTANGDGSRQVTLTRTYEGEPTRKLWQAMLAESGAPKKEVDGVLEASREEKLVTVTDPKTLRHRMVEDQATFAVTSKSGRAEKVDMHADGDRFDFTWR